MARHLTTAELEEGLDDILASPQDKGTLELIVRRPEVDARESLPEGRLALLQAAIYLALAPKSNALYTGFKAAEREVKHGANPPVPLHLRNAPTALMKGLGYGRDYESPHDAPDRFVATPNLPEELDAPVFYAPTDAGADKGNQFSKIRRNAAGLQGIERIPAYIEMRFSLLGC